MSTFNSSDVGHREEKEEIEIDLRQLLAVIIGKLWIVLLCGFVVAVTAFMATKVFVTPIYESTTKIYVLNRAGDNTNVTAADLQASAQLTKDYQELILSRTVLEQVIEEENYDLTYKEMVKKITVDTPADTRVIKIIASDPDPKTAQEIADAVRETSAEHIRKVMDTQAVNTVDEANLSVDPARPNAAKNTVIGGVAGMFLAMAVIIVIFIMDDRIKTVDDVEQYLGIGVLGSIPMVDQEKKRKTKTTVNRRGQPIKRKKRRY